MGRDREGKKADGAERLESDSLEEKGPRNTVTMACFGEGLGSQAVWNSAEQQKKHPGVMMTAETPHGLQPVCPHLHLRLLMCLYKL